MPLCLIRIPLAKGNTTSIPIGSAGKKPQMISKIAMPSSIHYGNQTFKIVKIISIFFLSFILQKALVFQTDF